MNTSMVGRSSVINESLQLGTAGVRYNWDECTVKVWGRRFQKGGDSIFHEDGCGGADETEEENAV